MSDNKPKGNLLVIILVIGIFVLIDIGLIVVTIIEANKLSQCTGQPSPFCPYMVCNSLMNDSGNFISGATPQIGYAQCSNLMYRLIDPNGSDTDTNNIECNLPQSSTNKSIRGPVAKGS